jgi:hypothetical protein
MKTLQKVLVLATGLTIGLCNLAHAGGASAENFFDGVYG